MELPDEVLRHIARKLPPDSLRTLPAVCTTFRTALAGDDTLRHRVRAQQALMAAVKHYGSQPRTWRKLDAARLLGLFSPEQRAKLVNGMLDDDDVFAPLTALKRSNAVRALAPQLVHLDEPLRQKLVAVVTGIDIGNREDAASALSALGAGLAHLSDDQRDQLITKAASLAEDKHRAKAICGLSAGLVHLTPAQRQALLTAALSMNQRSAYKGQAMQGLCAGLMHLRPEQRDRLFSRAVKLSNEQERAGAIRGLGASLENLSRDQQDTLVTTATGLTGINGFMQRWALCGLAEGGLGDLEPTLRDTLFSTLISVSQESDWDLSHAIEALGAAMKHLRPEQQDQLIEMAGSLDMDCPSKAEAVAGLAAGLEFLTPDRKAKVVDMALGLSVSNDKARAIGAACAMLAHPQGLDEGRYQSLLENAICLIKTDLSKEAMEALSGGLSAGLGALTPDQRNELVSAVAGRNPNRDDELASMSVAKAIAGLGAGLQHLSESQTASLIAAANKLWVDRDSRWTPSDWQWRIAEHRLQCHTIALAGLAAGASKVLSGQMYATDT